MILFHNNCYQEVFQLQMSMHLLPWAVYFKTFISNTVHIGAPGYITDVALKPIFHWKWGSRWLPNANEIQPQKMYLENTRILRLGPNATYIPLTRVGGFALGDTKNLRHPTQKIPTCWYICVRSCKSTQRKWFCVAVEFRLKC